MASPVTHIGSPASDISRFRMRGKEVLTDIIGKKSFSETFYFITTGREPTPEMARIFDACLIILMDHGITPMALVSRAVASAVPDDIQVPVSAGILMVGNKFVGSMTGCGRLLHQCFHQDADHRRWMGDRIDDLRQKKLFIPGFGHPYYHPDDPRAKRLFEVAKKNGAKGDFIRLIHLLGEEVDRSFGKHLALNVTGALAAVLLEIDFPLDAMRGCAVVGRAAGLVAHVLEEKKRPITPAVTEFINGIDYIENDGSSSDTAL